jgi:hypothetical protein
MATIKTVMVTYGRTWQAKPFEPAHFEVTLTAECGPDDDPTLVARALWNEAKESVREQARPILEARKAMAQ